MTNSTVEAASHSPAGAKRQGPIRSEALIPFAIVVALACAYLFLFLDTHLRQGLAYMGTRANGAEVNVGDVSTSLWKASLEVRDIQVTDADEPARNAVQIGHVRVRLLWDALLRGKVVVEDAEVADVQAFSPRATPGRVLPQDSKGRSLKDNVLAEVQGQFDSNVLGDLAALAQGGDPGAQLGKLDGQLKSSAHVKAMQAELAQKEQAWNDRLAALPKSETLAGLDRRLRSVKMDRFKDLQEVQASLKELDAIRSEINANVKSVEGAGKALSGDVGAYRNAYAELDQIVKQDVADLQAHFRIPELDAKAVAKVLFGRDLFAKVADARGYMDKARAYMPPKRSDEEKGARRLQPHERAEGRNYVFGRPNAYPLFWLKRAAVSSKSGSGPYAGDVSGEVRDVTTEPALIGRPTVATLEGNFPGQGIYDAKMELVVDHVTEMPVERLNVRVGRYGVTERPLVKSGAVDLGLAKADGRTELVAELRGQNVDLRMDTDLTGVAYQVEAKSPTREMIAGALDGVTAVNVNARVTGTWDRLEWSLASNLAEALERGFRQQVQAKVDQARARLQAMVDEKIAAERRKLQEQYAAAEAHVKAQLAAKQAEVDKVRAAWDKAKARFETEKTKFTKAQEQQLKKGADKYLNDLKKRL